MKIFRSLVRGIVFLLIFLVYSLYPVGGNATILFDGGYPDTSGAGWPRETSFSWLVEGYNLAQGEDVMEMSDQYASGGVSVGPYATTVDDFSVVQNSMLNSVTFWLTYNIDGGYRFAWDGTVEYVIYSSVDGNSVPTDNIIASGTTSSANCTSTSVEWGYGDVTMVLEELSFDLNESLFLSATETYWISLCLGSIYDPSENEWWDAYNASWWLSAETGFGSGVYQSVSGGEWQNVSQNSAAFRLEGELVKVPEPATLLLVGISLIGLVRYRRKH